MITILYDTNDNLITDLVNTAILNPTIIKVENQLLDGSFHVQTIGDRINIIDVICYVDKSNKEKMDTHNIECKPVKLVKEDKYYTGLIKEMSGWSEFLIGRLYECSFKLVVESEGLI